MRTIVRKIIVKTMKQYLEFEMKDINVHPHSLLTIPKGINKGSIVYEKLGFVTIHSNGNSTQYLHYWGKTELDAINNLYKELINSKLVVYKK